MARGGAKPGSGRPIVTPDKKRVQVSISVSPETKKMIQEMRSNGIKVGQVVDEMIRQYFEFED